MTVWPIAIVYSLAAHLVIRNMLFQFVSVIICLFWLLTRFSVDID